MAFSAAPASLFRPHRPAQFPRTGSDWPNLSYAFSRANQLLLGVGYSLNMAAYVLLTTWTRVGAVCRKRKGPPCAVGEPWRCLGYLLLALRFCNLLVLICPTPVVVRIPLPQMLLLSTWAKMLLVTDGHVAF